MADQNNNVTIGMEHSLPSAMSSTGAERTISRTLPPMPKSSPKGQTKTFELIQNFMIQKGIISNMMNETEFNDFLTKEMGMPAKKTTEKTKQPGPEINKSMDCTASSTSEATIYRQAVQYIALDLDSKIEELLNKTCAESVQKHKVSYSSDENMDTSDETVESDFNNLLINQSIVDAAPGPSCKTPEDQVIRDAEKGKERMFKVPGRTPIYFETVSQSVSLMDEDYQMIDMHIDENMKRK